jgi:glycosyltransferase involved in cell wall biosynthesis
LDIDAHSGERGNMIPVVFCLPGLDTGGSERQLLELVKGLDRRVFTVTVAVMYDGDGGLQAEFESIPDTEIIPLSKRPYTRGDLPGYVWRLCALFLRKRPHIVYSFLPLVNELSLFAGKLARAKVVWGLRASDMDWKRYSRALYWTFRVGAHLSRFTDLLIVNSVAGKEHHITHHYSREKMIVIPNGIDTDRFLPNVAAGNGLRARWGISEDALLIGQTARVDPVKDYPTFLRAARILHKRIPKVRFVCVGSGDGLYGVDIRRMSRDYGLEEVLLWAGNVMDMPGVYNAITLCSLSSLTEGFPNVLGEAMACGTPCVTTEVGDARRIVGDTGAVVPKENPEALASAWEKLLQEGPEGLTSRGAAARERIVRNFTTGKMVERTSQALRKLAAG